MAHTPRVASREVHNHSDSIWRRSAPRQRVMFSFRVADRENMLWSALTKCKPFLGGVTLTACLLFSCVLAQSQSDQDVMSLSIEELTQSKVFSASRHLEDSRHAPS